jgi:chemotaxis protein MotB
MKGVIMKGITTSILALSLLAFAGTAGAVDFGQICCDGGFEYRHPSAWEKEQLRLKNELAAAQKLLAERERELATLRSGSSAALQSTQAELDRTKKQLADLERSDAALRGKSAYALQTDKAELDQSKANIRDVERQLGERDRELYALRSSSEAALQSANASLDQSRTRVGELERQLADREKELASLNSAAGNASSQLASAQGDLAQSKARVAELEGQLAASQALAAGLQSGAGDKDKLAADLAAANQRTAALESQLAALQASNDEKGKLVADLEKKLADQDNELAGLRGDLSAEMAKLKEAQRGLIKALRPQIDKKTIAVDLNNERLLINLTSGYLFGSGEDVLKPAGADALKQVGAILKDFPEYKVSVDGHTDNRPIRSTLKKKFPTNQELSEARAANAAQALTEGGLGAAETHGYADTRPVAPNTTDAGRAQNRRVEVRVTK